MCPVESDGPGSCLLPGQTFSSLGPSLGEWGVQRGHAGAQGLLCSRPVEASALFGRSGGHRSYDSKTTGHCPDLWQR